MPSVFAQEHPDSCQWNLTSLLSKEKGLLEHREQCHSDAWSRPIQFRDTLNSREQQLNFLYYGILYIIKNSQEVRINIFNNVSKNSAS